MEKGGGKRSSPAKKKLQKARKIMLDEMKKKYLKLAQDKIDLSNNIYEDVDTFLISKKIIFLFRSKEIFIKLTQRCTQ